MKKTKPRIDDSYMLCFAAKYVSEIRSVSGPKERVQIIYYPKHDQEKTVMRSGKNSIEAFRNAIKSAILATNAMWGDGGDKEIREALQ